MANRGMVRVTAHRVQGGLRGQHIPRRERARRGLQQATYVDRHGQRA
jgi:hypothetical protein